MREVDAVVSGCSTSTSCGQKASGTRRAPRKHLESTSGPAIPRKATVPPYAAAIQFLGREPDPPKSGSSSPSALARMLEPPQSGSRSPAAIQLLHPSGATVAIAERCMSLIAEGRQINLEGSSFGTAMDGQTSISLRPSVAMKFGCAPDLRHLRKQFWQEEKRGRRLRGRSRCNTEYTEWLSNAVQSSQMFSWASPSGSARRSVSHAFLKQLPIGGYNCTVVERQSTTIARLRPVISQRIRW